MSRLKLFLVLLAVLAAAGIVYVYSAPTVRHIAAAPGQARQQIVTPVRLEREAVRGPLVIPVEGVVRAHLTDTWGQSREGGARAHQAIDIIAPGGTPVVAAMSGTVEKLFQSARGGTTVYVRSQDGRWTAYYAHLQRYADGLAEGRAVRAGQVIGYVGDTGNSGAGNYHLHFALARMRPGEKWYDGEPVNPYPILVGQAALR